jgi:hypothetical protein
VWTIEIRVNGEKYELMIHHIRLVYETDCC